MAKQAAKFEDLDRDAAAIPYASPLYDPVISIIADAENNMPDEEGRIASVVCLLSYTKDKAVLAWFARRGITA
jgi:hypothetical protein